jgi:group I intron endonuclease
MAILSDFRPHAGVYQITCLVNGKVYIGQSKYLNARFSEHVKHLLENIHSTHELQSDFNAYGIDAFEIVILEECEPSEVLPKELEWAVRRYNEGKHLYNLNDKRILLACKPELRQDPFTWEKKRRSYG